MTQDRYAALYEPNFKKNLIFQVEDNKLNPNNVLIPYRKLRDRLKKSNIDLCTHDMCGDSPIFELHINAQNHRLFKKIPIFLLIFETPLIWPNNANKEILSKYDLIFTWDDEIVDDKKFIKYDIPRYLDITNETLGFKDRDLFCSLIARNKTSLTNDYRCLYPERVKAIKWYEKNAPDSFHLYGDGWDMPPLTEMNGALERRFWRLAKRFIKKTYFSSYRGTIDNKLDIFKRSKFAICYENASLFSGYITEKIFDCFYAGCVPIYLGAENIEDYIPIGCFIDRRKFKTERQLFDFLKNMTEEDYKKKQLAILAFMNGKKVERFNLDFFSENITSNILKKIN